MADIINIDDFTQGTINGKGVFDVLMTTVKAHLKEEFDAGRIRATDYSNAYVQLMSVVLAESAQFVISKAKLEAEIKLLESQARGEDVSTDIKQYQLDCILPKEANNLLLVGIRTGAETTQAVQQTNNLMEQHKGITTDNDIKKFQLSDILPSEKSRTLEQITGMQKDNDMKSFQIDFVLPKELEIKDAQVNVALKDLDLKAKQLELSDYELTHKLPADVALVTAQDGLYTQKSVTEKAQVDNTIVGVGSVIDLSNKLLEEQANAYVVNANQTAAKLMIDTWVVRHTADPEGNLETDDGLRLTNADIGLAVAKIL